MSWTQYNEPIINLRTEDINNVSANHNEIYKLMTEKGYTVEKPVGIIISANVHISKTKTILTEMENGLDKLANAGLFSPYYIAPHTIGEYASNKEDIWRWILTLNDWYEMLTGKWGKWGTLLCSDGYPTINGSRLVAKENL